MNNINQYISYICELKNEKNEREHLGLGCGYVDCSIIIMNLEKNEVERKLRGHQR
jgi:hypothetical protein